MKKNKPKFYKQLLDCYPESNIAYSRREPEPRSCCNKTGKEYIILEKEDYSTFNFKFVRSGFKGRWRILLWESSHRIQSKKVHRYNRIRITEGKVEGIKDLNKVIKLLS